jgi:hypothetical protein
MTCHTATFVDNDIMHVSQIVNRGVLLAFASNSTLKPAAVWIRHCTAFVMHAHDLTAHVLELVETTPPPSTR